MVFLANPHKTRIFAIKCPYFWYSIPAYYPHFRKKYTRIIPAFWPNLTCGRLCQHCTPYSSPYCCIAPHRTRLHHYLLLHCTTPYLINPSPSPLHRPPPSGRRPGGRQTPPGRRSGRRRRKRPGGQLHTTHCSVSSAHLQVLAAQLQELWTPAATKPVHVTGQRDQG